MVLSIPNEDNKALTAVTAIAGGTQRQQHDTMDQQQSCCSLGRRVWVRQL